jgi:hypothetical protein
MFLKNQSKQNGRGSVTTQATGLVITEMIGERLVGSVTEGRKTLLNIYYESAFGPRYNKCVLQRTSLFSSLMEYFALGK